MVRYVIPVGVPVPLWLGASGHVLLSAAPPKVQKAVISAGDLGEAGEAALEEQLERTLEDGYSVTFRPRRAGCRSSAVGRVRERSGAGGIQAGGEAADLPAGPWDLGELAGEFLNLRPRVPPLMGTWQATANPALGPEPFGEIAGPAAGSMPFAGQACHMPSARSAGSAAVVVVAGAG